MSYLPSVTGNMGKILAVDKSSTKHLKKGENG